MERLELKELIRRPGCIERDKSNALKKRKGQHVVFPIPSSHSLGHWPKRILKRIVKRTLKRIVSMLPCFLFPSFSLSFCRPSFPRCCGWRCATFAPPRIVLLSLLSSFFFFALSLHTRISLSRSQSPFFSFSFFVFCSLPVLIRSPPASGVLPVSFPVSAVPCAVRLPSKRRFLGSLASFRFLRFPAPSPCLLPCVLFSSPCSPRLIFPPLAGSPLHFDEDREDVGERDDSDGLSVVVADVESVERRVLESFDGCSERFVGLHGHDGLSDLGAEG